MKKLLTLFFVFLFILSLCGCGDLTNELDIVSTSSLPAADDEASSIITLETSSEASSKPSSEISSIVSSKISRITEEEAIEIASKHWGIKSGDIDEKTGFSFLIMPAQSSNDNIKIVLKWLVNNEHYSTVDFVEINPYTGEILNGYAEE